MSTVDEHIERLIVRRLDGELTDDEVLELNRELIRNPQARWLLETYERVDGLCETVLAGVVADKPLSSDPTAGRRIISRNHHPYRYRMWLLASGAVAAALLALVVPLPSAGPLSDDVQSVAVEDVQPVAPIADSPILNENGLMRNIGMDPHGPRIKRRTGRDVFGIMGDDGNIYWIQVDRVRTMRRPAESSEVRPAREIL
ncbi:MAG: hypothetical protein JSU63_03670 [Phycisphaerales bacterium]|nr:MAG: hypothetical protein JSU63_03670 [Phycisphaerales bacterium]